MIDATRLASYLPGKRWFAGRGRPIERLTIVTEVQLRDDWPLLVRLVVAVESGGPRAEYQVLLGVRPMGQPADFLRGHDDAVLGEIDTPRGPGFAYDATLDHELGLALLRLVAPDQDVHIVRPVGAEQTNTSLVYDDRLILKLYRRLETGPNPDVEVTSTLAGLGFAHVAEPVASWRVDGRDLAFVQRYLSGGTDGWSLALTSLRDVFALHDTQQLPIVRFDEPPPPVVPADAGGDFASEANRLGAVTAELHEAMAGAYGRHPADPGAWAEGIRGRLDRAGEDLHDRGVADVLFARLAGLVDPGPAIRVHGDLHLGQVMRTDDGWYVLDFEGEPARPLAERAAPTSPLRDVAGMLRSLHYAAQIALRERGAELDEAVVTTADAWERRNREAFLSGYVPAAEAAGLLPADHAARSTILTAFELDKAVYELGYELAHRPDWAGIPLQAVRRMLEGA